MNTKKITKSSRGRPVGDHDEKRHELLCTAIRLLVTDGYAGLSMRNLASRAQVTTGAITYYFANKSELMKGISDELFNRFTLLVAKNSEIDVKQAVEEWINWSYSDGGEIWKAFLQIQLYATEDQAFIDYAQKRYDIFISQLRTFIESGQKLKQIRNDISADILAEQLSAMGDGFMIMQFICPERLSIEKVALLKKGILSLISPQLAV